jgi:hypothetical protein
VKPSKIERDIWVEAQQYARPFSLII